MFKETNVLLISQEREDHGRITALLHQPHWRVASAYTVAEGVEAVGKGEIGIVLCDRNLPDGTWQQLFEAVDALEPSPLFIAVCLHADEALWAEVLNLGGYDVLSKPFHVDEVGRVLLHAYHAWHRERKV